MNNEDNAGHFEWGFTTEKGVPQEHLNREFLKEFSQHISEIATGEKVPRCTSERCAFSRLINLYSSEQLQAVKEVLASMVAVDMSLYGSTSQTSKDIFFHIASTITERENEFEVDEILTDEKNS